jgi:phenylalanine-4-hydroxylase
MQAQTGWKIRPVKGLVKPRDFLEGIAHKVFCSTIYIRCEGETMFTTAPDMIHEVFGHCLPLMVPEISHV